MAHPLYNTDDVLKYLYGEVPPLAPAMEGATPGGEDGER